jgi:hypothetical protein
LLSFKMIANGRVAFNSDDCAPVAGSIFIFEFLY